jgi:hypothetical protein
MDSTHQEQYIIYVRHDRSHSTRPDHSEQPLTSCASYEEARRIQQYVRSPARECVIRYIGEVGGGD